MSKSNTEGITQILTVSTGSKNDRVMGHFTAGEYALASEGHLMLLKEYSKNLALIFHFLI